ncbi:rRNA maturation RNase YbeY [Palleronia sp. KMU-117]|uniref:rRNA maturation RNase YbeY n=1 Tax=Palleronia sp. KMU-117 TaxID=3434108 RepID=UPI003D74E28E
MAAQVEVLVEGGDWDAAALEALALRAVAATFGHLGIGGDLEVAVLACDDARIAALNADFRGKPQPTNVLSWPSEDRGADEDGAVPRPPEAGEDTLGDIAIAHETCLREAAEAARPFEDHVAHLLVHATLHLLGYDHTRPKDAELMEGLEVEILATLGVPDPY